MSRQPYLRPMSRTTWYLHNSRYRRYMLREVTCLLVAFYCGLMIWALAALAGNAPAAWDNFLAAQQHPVLIAVHGAALIYYLVYMTFDWFKLAPKAMVVQAGEKVLPDRVIVFGHYAAWILLTLVVFWLAGVF